MFFNFSFIEKESGVKMGYIHLKPNSSSHWLFVAIVNKQKKKEKEEKGKEEVEKVAVGQR